MVTPRQPNAKPGRPPPDFSRFARDPHRYPISLALGLQQFGLSERRSFDMVAAKLLGKKVEEHFASSRRRRGVGMVPAGRLATYDRVRAQHITTTSASFRNFGSTLKKKARRIRRDDPTSQRWLDLTAHGIAAFLSSGYLLGYDLEQLMEHVIISADRALSGNLPGHFLDALDFDAKNFNPPVARILSPS
jgi:hypothetical protein